MSDAEDRRQGDEAIPRWARELGVETWERINELLHDGWDTPDIVRELNVPSSKLRSLQLYARKFGPRRRLILFDRFKQKLLEGAVEFSPEFAQALSLIAQKAVSPKVKDSTQVRAAELLTQFTKALSGMMAVDEEAEAKRGEERSGKVDRDEVVREILDVYGLRGKPGHGP